MLWVTETLQWTLWNNFKLEVTLYHIPAPCVSAWLIRLVLSVTSGSFFIKLQFQFQHAKAFHKWQGFTCPV